METRKRKSLGLLMRKILSEFCILVDRRCGNSWLLNFAKLDIDQTQNKERIARSVFIKRRVFLGKIFHSFSPLFHTRLLISKRRRTSKVFAHTAYQFAFLFLLLAIRLFFPIVRRYFVSVFTRRSCEIHGRPKEGKTHKK